jgi:carboxymethylenebutenolidase
LARRFYASGVEPAHIEADFTAVLDHVAQRSDVKAGGVGITGYCMGGTIALRVAARFGERIAFAASFHGGNLVTDAADSPHLGAASIARKCMLLVLSKMLRFRTTRGPN